VQGGAPGEAAQRALLAYPPPLAGLVGGKKRLPPEIVRFLGELGDLRAIERLRPMLEGGDVGSQIAAAVALAKLGDEAALARARAWLKGPANAESRPTLKKPEPRLLRAAAEVLVYLGAPEAPDAVAALLRSDARLDALQLAELLPAPAFAPKLARAIPDLPEEARPRAVAALGRAGGAEAIKALRGLFEQPELAAAAAFALATMPGEPARAALAELAVGPRARKDRDLDRLLLRAAIVRAVTLGDPPAALEERLRSMRSAKGATDRAVAAFGLAALGLGDIEELAGGCFPGLQASPLRPRTPGDGARAAGPACDGAALHAAARGALARGGKAPARFAALLESPSAPPEATIAAGVALIEDPSGGAIPTSRLAAWAEAGGALAPLAARALGGRDDEVVRGTIKRLLEGSDPVIRAHVALGLGRDPEPDGVSLLAGAYRFEEDPAVRRAIVRGLSRRAEVQRRRTLTLARDLDPDSIVRSLARAALEGRPLDQPASPLATGVAWIRVIPNDGAAAVSAAVRAARVIRSDGLAIPVVADPDGVILVPGMPPGLSALVLASAVPTGDSVPR
jgi:HEAT repeat protein